MTLCRKPIGFGHRFNENNQFIRLLRRRLLV
jgi:hypothetical protein